MAFQAEILVCGTPYGDLQKYFLEVPWEQYWAPALPLTWSREGQKVSKWFQEHIWDKNLVILKYGPIWVIWENFGK